MSVESVLHRLIDLVVSHPETNVALHEELGGVKPVETIADGNLPEGEGGPGDEQAEQKAGAETGQAPGTAPTGTAPAATEPALPAEEPPGA